MFTPLKQTVHELLPQLYSTLTIIQNFHSDRGVSKEEELSLGGLSTWMDQSLNKE